MKRREFFKKAGLGSAALASLPTLAEPARAADKADEHATGIRWDIVHFSSFSPPTIEAGGEASALADDMSKITVTGSGTFVPGDSEEVTGGGHWETRDKDGNLTGSGTYRVRRLVRFTMAPGTLPPPPFTDNIGNPADARSGLAFLSVVYSDRSQGILVVSCHLPVGTPNSIFEGITASKGFVDYWNREAAVAGVDGNRTVFHVIRGDDEE